MDSQLDIAKLVAGARAYPDVHPGGYGWLLNRLADALDGERSAAEGGQDATRPMTNAEWCNDLLDQAERAEDGFVKMRLVATAQEVLHGQHDASLYRPAQPKLDALVKPISKQEVEMDEMKP